jgi:hypothetical protein
MATKTTKYKKDKWDLDMFSELTAWELRDLAKNTKDIKIDVSINILNQKEKTRKKLMWG